MTMYVVAGDGEMPKEDLKATLDDQEASAVQEDRNFWMLVQARIEPTATDRALMAWVKEHDTYYETYGPEATKPDAIYAGAQEKHAVKGITAKIVELLQSKPEDGEDAVFLALFASDDPDAPEDVELMNTVTAVLNAGFPVFALNDGMAPINLVEDGESADEATDEVVEPPSQAAMEQEEWTRETLEALNPEQIKEIAAGFGITKPPKTRATTYIQAILDRDKTPEAEVEVEDVKVPEAEATFTTTANGSNGANQSFDAVKSILRSLGEALIAASK